MAIMNKLRSPVPWMGGKFYSAERIVKAFPSPNTYDVFVDLFGGAAHVLLAKPPFKHIEVYNDINDDLVNFWLHMRDHAEMLEERCSSLPYARSLYYQYHQSLFDGTELEPLERAVRWFYVLRSNFSGKPLRPAADGWISSVTASGHINVTAYQSALDLFMPLSQRFQCVMIDNRDFSFVLEQWNKPRTLFYCDPPYIDAEHYYNQSFGREDHQRLAALLNATPASVALSYYPHPLLDEWYPASKWRRVTWQTVKHSQHTKKHHDKATEMLLCNYPMPASLWSIEEEREEA